MRSHGTLVKWNEDRGFGFIQPSDGSAELFVHVSAFPRDDRVRVRLNELVSFEIETKPDGKRRAVRIMRPLALGPASRSHGRAPRPEHHPGKRIHHSSRRSMQLSPALVLLAVIVVSYYVYQQMDWAAIRPSMIQPASSIAVPAPDHSSANFRCDGRRHCSQMRSCAEATFFLRNCPSTQMDGDGDGIPCEHQWCN